MGRMGFVSVSVMTHHKETRDSLACTRVFFFFFFSFFSSGKAFNLAFYMVSGIGLGSVLPTAERAFWWEGGRWIPAPFWIRICFFFFFKEKKKNLLLSQSSSC